MKDRYYQHTNDSNSDSVTSPCFPDFWNTCTVGYEHVVTNAFGYRAAMSGNAYSDDAVIASMTAVSTTAAVERIVYRWKPDPSHPTSKAGIKQKYTMTQDGYIELFASHSSALMAAYVHVADSHGHELTSVLSHTKSTGSGLSFSGSLPGGLSWEFSGAGNVGAANYPIPAYPALDSSGESNPCDDFYEITFRSSAYIEVHATHVYLIGSRAKVWAEGLVDADIKQPTFLDECCDGDPSDPNPEDPGQL